MTDRFDSCGYKRTVHFSIDDVGASLRYISQSTPASVWDMRFFGKLHEFRERFGLEITLYCFWEIDDGFTYYDIPKRYMCEFAENSKWLKFGFHSKNKEPFKSSSDWERSFDAFNNINRQYKIGETDILRLHYWEATKEQKRILSTKGVTTLLSPPDYERVTYENGICHRRTNTYFEKVNEDITSSVLEIGAPCLIAFTHEQAFERQMQRIEVALNLYTKNDYCFLS